VRGKVGGKETKGGQWGRIKERVGALGETHKKWKRKKQQGGVRYRGPRGKTQTREAGNQGVARLTRQIERQQYSCELHRETWRGEWRVEND